MNYRWTVRELNEIKIEDFIKIILEERKSNLNYYSPLSKKLKKAIHFIKNTKK